MYYSLWLLNIWTSVHSLINFKDFLVWDNKTRRKQPCIFHICFLKAYIFIYTIVSIKSTIDLICKFFRHVVKCENWPSILEDDPFHYILLATFINSYILVQFFLLELHKHQQLWLQKSIKQLGPWSISTTCIQSTNWGWSVAMSSLSKICPTPTRGLQERHSTTTKSSLMLLAFKISFHYLLMRQW